MCLAYPMALQAEPMSASPAGREERSVMPRRYAGRKHMASRYVFLVPDSRQAASRGGREPCVGVWGGDHSALRARGPCVGGDNSGVGPLARRSWGFGLACTSLGYFSLTDACCCSTRSCIYAVDMFVLYMAGCLHDTPTATPPLPT